VELSTQDLTDALKSNSTSKIIRYMGDISHYVADAAQPFHATKNFDGQLTDNQGIHSRYEVTLIEYYWEELFDIENFEAVRVVDDPYELSESQIETGLALVPDILRADDLASAVAGDKNSNEYYEGLYNRTKDITKSRLTLAIQNTANLWATAFHNAGWIEIIEEANSTTLVSTTTSDTLMSSSTQSQVSYPISSFILLPPILLYKVQRKSRI
jgi:hypothetical protein